MVIINKKLIFISNLFVLCLALVVMYGWFSSNYELTSISSNWPNMQFNTAFCFACLTFAGLLIDLKLYKVAKLFFIIVI